jgi:hypothetical protein
VSERGSWRETRARVWDWLVRVRVLGCWRAGSRCDVVGDGGRGTIELGLGRRFPGGAVLRRGRSGMMPRRGRGSEHAFLR